MSYSVTFSSKEAPHDPATLKLWREAMFIRRQRMLTEVALEKLDQKSADLLPATSDVMVRNHCTSSKATLNGYLQRGEFNTMKMLQAEIQQDDSTTEIFVEVKPCDTKTILRKLTGTQSHGQWTLHEDVCRSTLLMEYEP